MNRAHSRSRLKNPPATLVPAFDPVQLFSNGEQGAWYDPSDLSTLFQDAAGTIPVTTTGQPVGLVVDKSGRGNNASQAVAASMPIFRDVGGLRYLEFDGVDDFLATASVNFTVTDKLSLWAGVTRSKDTSTGVIVELSDNSNNRDAFLLTCPEAVSTSVALSNRGVGFLASTAMYDDGVTPQTTVMSGGIDRALTTREVIYMRRNGASPPLARPVNADTTGNFGNFPMYIARRGGASLPFSGNIYGLIIRGSLSDISVIAVTELYLAGKTGVVI